MSDRDLWARRYLSNASSRMLNSSQPKNLSRSTPRAAGVLFMKGGSPGFCSTTLSRIKHTERKSIFVECTFNYYSHSKGLVVVF